MATSLKCGRISFFLNAKECVGHVAKGSAPLAYSHASKVQAIPPASCRTWFTMSGFGRLRSLGDRQTGGGLRSLANRRLKGLRAAANRITGGGLRALARRLFSRSLRRAMSHSFLKAVGRSPLQPFPKLRFGDPQPTEGMLNDIGNIH
jgi:hypothetical protein